MTSLEDINDFECAICTEILVYPVVLPCKHKFCKECLTQHFANNHFNCPLCRTRLSNWLRKINRKKENLVDESLWKKIQKKFPNKVLKQRNNQSADEAPDSNELTNSEICDNVKIPKPRISLPGEIRKEFEEMQRKEKERLRLEEEKQMKLSEELIRMIEEDQRREDEVLNEQLRIDEEIARKLREEEELAAKTLAAAKQAMNTSASSGSRPSVASGFTDCSNDDTPSDPDWPLRILGDSPVYLGPVPKQDVVIPSPPASFCSTPVSTKANRAAARAALNISPIRLDMPSTSTDVRYGRLFNPVPSEVPSTDEPIRSSHFAAVPSSSQGERVTRPETISESRCSSGNDSISQELHHFKPIRTSPTTRAKDGSPNMMPHLVVAQKAVPGLSVVRSLSHIDEDEPIPIIVEVVDSPPPPTPTPTPMDEDDEVLSRVQQILIEQQIQELKRKRAQQIEEDAKLAREIAEADQNEMRRTNPLNKVNRSSYNLRKRSKPSLKKKVLIDRAQTTLDNMLIKN